MPFRLSKGFGGIGADRRTKPGQVRPAVGHAMPMEILDLVWSVVPGGHCLAVAQCL